MIGAAGVCISMILWTEKLRCILLERVGQKNLELMLLQPYGKAFVLKLMNLVYKIWGINLVYNVWLLGVICIVTYLMTVILDKYLKWMIRIPTFGEKEKI